MLHHEISEDEIVITRDQLGRGLFGKVYLADYNGRSVAAKVWSGIAVLMTGVMSIGLTLERIRLDTNRTTSQLL